MTSTPATSAPPRGVSVARPRRWTTRWARSIQPTVGTPAPATAPRPHRSANTTGIADPTARRPPHSRRSSTRPTPRLGRRWIGTTHRRGPTRRRRTSSIRRWIDHPGPISLLAAPVGSTRRPIGRMRNRGRTIGLLDHRHPLPGFPRAATVLPPTPLGGTVPARHRHAACPARRSGRCARRCAKPIWCAPTSRFPRSGGARNCTRSRGSTPASGRQSGNGSTSSAAWASTCAAPTSSRSCSRRAARRRPRPRSAWGRRCRGTATTRSSRSTPTRPTATWPAGWTSRAQEPGEA